MAKKRPKINGLSVIGFDETNNGFHLNNRYGVDLPLLIVGYLIPKYPGSHHANEKYEKKGGVFTLEEGKNVWGLKDVQRRGLGYLHTHQDFFYSRIFEKDLKGKSIESLRARAVAAVVLRFFEEYRLSEKETCICLDHLGVDCSTEDLDFVLKEFLKYSGLYRDNEKNIYFQQYAGKFNRACKTADHVGYHLLGLKFRGDRGRWPFRDRITDPNSYYDSLIRRTHPEEQ